MSLLQPPVASSPLPWADRFFAGAITNRRLAHAYILKGKAYSSMYQLALKLAQVLNCQNRPQLTVEALELDALSCKQCASCRWVASNSHPAVLTVSRLTYQVSEKGELLTQDELEKQAKKSPSTQIKTDQIGHLIRQLNMSSDATRVVIFTDAEELPADMPSDVTAPFDWRSVEANADKSFHIRPLTRDVFNAFSVNKFLKTLEEPPHKTLFLFITETEEQLLETIVSRCQVIPCSTGQITQSTQALPDDVDIFVRDLLQKVHQGEDAYLSAGAFEAFFMMEKGFNLLQALECMQATVRQQWLQTSADTLQPANFSAYRKLQTLIQEAIQMLDAKTNEKQVLLNLFLKLSRCS